MPILTTNQGLNAMADAEAGGFLLSFGKFSVTEATDVQLTVDDVALVGPVIYEASVQNIEVVGPSTVLVTAYLPVSFPSSGEVKISEFGLYLTSGQLFAHGTFKAPYVKNSEFGLRILTYVTARRLTEVINITVSTNSSLASTANVHTLPSPLESEQNAVIVFDENENSDLTTSASLALKYGPGGLNWAFVGHKRIFHGNSKQIISDTKFSIGPIKKRGIWLNDQEVVIIQITSGPGVGRSRKVRYNKATEVFDVLRGPLVELTLDSEIALWRDDASALPSRQTDLAEYMVLGHGTTTYKRNVNTSKVGDLIPHRVTSVSGGSRIITLPADVPSDLFDDKKNFIVWAAGRLVPVQGYDVSGSNLLLDFTPPVGTVIEVFYYVTVESTGSSLVFYEAKFEDRVANIVPNTTSGWYQLPIVPQGIEFAMVFLDEVLLDPSKYEFKPAAIHFTGGNVSGVLTVLSYANYEDAGSATQLDRIDVVSNGSAKFTFRKDIGSKKNVLGTINGKYVSQDKFTQVGARDIVLKVNPALGDIVTWVLFSAGPQPKTATEAGYDTGPQWVDPIGRIGPPNLIIPRIRSSVGDGVNRIFGAWQVSDKKYLLVFVDQKVIDARTYTYDIVTSKVELAVPVPNTKSIDIISFVDVTDPDEIIGLGYPAGAELGNMVDCVVTRVTLTAALTYTLNKTPFDGDHVIVTVGGMYVHHNKFGVIGDQLTLVAGSTIPGAVMEVWDLRFTPTEGMRTEVYWDFDRIRRTYTLAYPIRKPVTKVENTLIFNSASAAMYGKDKYTTSQSADGRFGQVVLPVIPATEVGHELFCLTFVSGVPLPRLASMADLENYVPAGSGKVNWDDLSPEVVERLACPMAKLLGIATGVMDAEFKASNGSADDILLADKWGLRPVVKTLQMDVIPTANYASVGAGMALGVEQHFNVYDYLNLYLKDVLGNASFTINKWERGVKYIIDDVSIGAIQTEVIQRSEIPMISYGTGIYIDYPNKLMSTTYPTMPYLTSFFDMTFSRDNVSLPAGFNPADNKLRTVSATIDDDNATQYHIYTHVIFSAYTGAQYTVVWKRQYQVTDLNKEYMILVDGGGAPGYVQYFARLYCNWKYNDFDLRMCMYYNKVCQFNGGSADYGWPAWIVSIQGGSAGGNYPAVAAYTAGLTFGVTVSGYDPATGDAVVEVKMTSGDIGYAYFPANALVKKITIPVTYTVYPGMIVNPDGTIKPVMSLGDLFSSCCWGPVSDTVTKLNCD